MTDADVDQLYALPLDEFVSARNALAKERKDPSLRKLRKPSIAAWWVDRLARSHEASMRALVDAAAAVRRAQQRALSGARHGGGDLRDASRAHRSAVDALVDALPADTSPGIVERVRSTLAAASLDEALVDDLADGRLVDDVDPAGFGDLSGLEVFAGALADDDREDDGDGGDTRQEPDPRAGERAAAQQVLDDATAVLDDAKAREADARRALDRSYDAVRDAERAVEDARRRLSDLG